MSKLQWIQEKIADRTVLARRCAAWRAAGNRVVFTNGCFDLLHPGHLDYLARAADAGNKLVVGLNSDASVRRLKGAGTSRQPRSRPGAGAGVPAGGRCRMPF